MDRAGEPAHCFWGGARLRGCSLHRGARGRMFVPRGVDRPWPPSPQHASRPLDGTAMLSAAGNRACPPLPECRPTGVRLACATGGPISSSPSPSAGPRFDRVGPTTGSCSNCRRPPWTVGVRPRSSNPRAAREGTAARGCAAHGREVGPASVPVLVVPAGSALSAAQVGVAVVRWGSDDSGGPAGCGTRRPPLGPRQVRVRAGGPGCTAGLARRTGEPSGTISAMCPGWPVQRPGDRSGYPCVRGGGPQWSPLSRSATLRGAGDVRGADRFPIRG